MNNCQNVSNQVHFKEFSENDCSPFIYILGTAQDGGYPQTGCLKNCCNKLWDSKQLQNYVTSLALIMPTDKSYYIFDCTPDFKYQLKLTQQFLPINPSGIFLTHAHMGHYVGLLNLGRECMNSKNLDVYAYEKMSKFLKNNAPFSQLISIENIKINELKENEKVHLSSNIIIEHFLVDHRGEYSETCGYRIIGPNKKVIFIPDIDSFDDIDIRKLVLENDYIFLDGTFYSGEEINFRNIKEIPHPLIEDSVKLFDSLLSYEDKSKVYFIHLNHTNPLWDKSSDQYRLSTEKGYKVAEQNQKIYI